MNNAGTGRGGGEVGWLRPGKAAGREVMGWVAPRAAPGGGEAGCRWLPLPSTAVGGDHTPELTQMSQTA